MRIKESNIGLANLQAILFQIVHKIRHFLEKLSNFVPWCISEKSQPKKTAEKVPPVELLRHDFFATLPQFFSSHP